MAKLSIVNVFDLSFYQSHTYKHENLKPAIRKWSFYGRYHQIQVHLNTPTDLKKKFLSMTFVDSEQKTPVIFFNDFYIFYLVKFGMTAYKFKFSRLGNI